MSVEKATKYILIDISNGDALEPRGASRIYFWEFQTLQKAHDFLVKHNSLKSHSELVGPFEVGPGIERFGGTYRFLERTE